jgi:hypothetical protein
MQIYLFLYFKQDYIINNTFFQTYQKFNVIISVKMNFLSSENYFRFTFVYKKEINFNLFNIFYRKFIIDSIITLINNYHIQILKQK